MWKVRSNLRETVRDIVREELRQAGKARKSLDQKRAATRTEADDDGRKGRPRLHTNHTDLLHQIKKLMMDAEADWGHPVTYVLEHLEPKIKHHSTLKRRLIDAGVMTKADSLADTLAKIGRDRRYQLDAYIDDFPSQSSSKSAS